MMRSLTKRPKGKEKGAPESGTDLKTTRAICTVCWLVNKIKCTWDNAHAEDTYHRLSNSGCRDIDIRPDEKDINVPVNESSEDSMHPVKRTLRLTMQFSSVIESACTRRVWISGETECNKN